MQLGGPNPVAPAHQCVLCWSHCVAQPPHSSSLRQARGVIERPVEELSPGVMEGRSVSLAFG
jgi:hypothetical protein